MLSWASHEHNWPVPSDQVQIYEPILEDQDGHVTTALLHAVGYLKDNRLLPAGFEKQTAEKDIAVTGDAADDPNFTDAGNLIRYSVSLGDAPGPFHVDVGLWYEPIGFRWAHNLSAYKAKEPQRFVEYYETSPAETAIVLAHSAATRRVETVRSFYINVKLLWDRRIRDGLQTKRNNLGADYFAGYHQFHPTILLAAFRRFIRSDWPRLPEARRSR